MVKRIVLTILQFAAFLGLLDLGGNWDIINFSLQVRAMQNHTTAFNPIPVMKHQISPTHILIADGIVFATVLFLLILLLEALRKKFNPWLGLTVLAYVAAVAVGFAMKFGFLPA